MNKALTALAMAVLLTVSACGSGDTDSGLSKTEQKAADNIAGELSGSDGARLDKNEATCFADKFVGDTGVPALQDAGLLDKEEQVKKTGATFDKGLAEKYADAYLACVDFSKQVAQAYAAQDDTLDAEAFGRCLDDNLPKDLIRQVIIDNQTGGSGDDKSVTKAQQAVTRCQQRAAKKGGKPDKPAEKSEQKGSKKQ